MHKTGRPVEEVIQENHPDMLSTPMENPTCTAFKDYEYVPETVPLDFMEDDVMWVVSNISGIAGALGEEAIEPINGILHFGCVW